MTAAADGRTTMTAAADRSHRTRPPLPARHRRLYVPRMPDYLPRLPHEQEPVSDSLLEQPARKHTAYPDDDTNPTSSERQDMKTPPTPGPWIVDGINTGRPVILSGTGVNYQEIAYVFLLQKGGIEVGKANARLIAASPELYAFVQKVAEVGMTHGYPNTAESKALFGLWQQAQALLTQLNTPA